MSKWRYSVVAVKLQWCHSGVTLGVGLANIGGFSGGVLGVTGVLALGSFAFWERKGGVKAEYDGVQSGEG
jgi:hypothetical protein